MELSALKAAFETFERIKKAFESLKKSNLFLKETNIHDLIEKYFALEPLPKGKIKLIGRLSNYTLNNKFPIYTPGHIWATKQSTSSSFIPFYEKYENKIKLELKTRALNVPAISYRPIQLVDKSSAKILWLYPEYSEGLVFNVKEKMKLSKDNLCEVFGIESKDKPIPILVSPDFPNYYLYQTVKVTGLLNTSAIDFFENLNNNTDGFILDYFSNCFRPFSSQNGILAIDARPPFGQIEKIGENKKPFKIIYTVQGTIEVPEQINENEHQRVLVMSECIDAIPDRQGLTKDARFFGDAVHQAHSIITLGNTFWQRNKNELSIAAFKELDLNNANINQSSLTELAFNWQVWQKNARKRIRDNFGVEPKIRPLICSNSFHDKTFHPNGLQISKVVEEKLLSGNPQVRQSIDWLGISIGK